MTPRTNRTNWNINVQTRNKKRKSIFCSVDGWENALSLKANYTKQEKSISLRKGTYCSTDIVLSEHSILSLAVKQIKQEKKTFYSIKKMEYQEV